MWDIIIKNSGWKGLWSQLVQPLLKAGLISTLDEVAQGYIWLSFQNTMGGWLHCLPVQPSPLLSLHCEECFLLMSLWTIFSFHPVWILLVICDCCPSFFELQEVPVLPFPFAFLGSGRQWLGYAPAFPRLNSFWAWKCQDSSHWFFGYHTASSCEAHAH